LEGPVNIPHVAPDGCQTVSRTEA